MYKNNIIELYPDATKQLLYAALEQNQNIMYTLNERTIPDYNNLYMIKAYNRNYIIAVEPNTKQVEYFDYTIQDIKTAIEQDGNIVITDLQNFLLKTNKDKFIHALENSPFSFLNQYDANTIYDYIVNTLN